MQLTPPDGGAPISPNLEPTARIVPCLILGGADIIASRDVLVAEPKDNSTASPSSQTETTAKSYED